ncbi:MAG: hypothetical protein ACLQIH_16145 [Myxococcaceae bacterium]
MLRPPDVAVPAVGGAKALWFARDARPVGHLALALLGVLLVCASCSTGGAKSVPTVPLAPLFRDCTVAAPCDRVRQQWFVNEAKNAELWAQFCNPPAAGNANDCAGLGGAVANLHRLNIEYFSDFCLRNAEKPSATVSPWVGRPDRDETATCGAGQCRLWIWYWFGGGQSGIFTMLFRLPPASSEWLLKRCNYCTPAACQDMPLQL